MAEQREKQPFESFAQAMQRRNREAAALTKAYYENPENDRGDVSEAFVETVLRIIDEYLAGKDPGMVLTDTEYWITKPSFERNMAGPMFEDGERDLDAVLDFFPVEYVLETITKLMTAYSKGQIAPDGRAALLHLYTRYRAIKDSGVESGRELDFSAIDDGIAGYLKRQGLNERDLFLKAPADKPVKESEYFRRIAEAVASMQAAEIDRIGKVKPITKPTSYIIPNSKIANKYADLQDIFLRIAPDGQLTFVPGITDQNTAPVEVRKSWRQGKANYKEVNTFVSLNYVGDLDGKLARISGYDRCVMNAVASLWLAGNNIFTIDDVWYTLMQKDRGDSKPTENSRKRIRLALLKFSGMRIYMDVTEEIKAKMLTPDGDKIKPIISEPLLSYREYIAKTSKGGEKIAVQILTEPILLAYSRRRKNAQLVTIPVAWLQVQDISDREDQIVLRDYILKEIRQILTGHRDNDTISYSSIMAQLEVNSAELSWTERSRYADKVRNILETCKKNSIIGGWEQRTGARKAVTGFRIIPPAAELPGTGETE